MVTQLLQICEISIYIENVTILSYFCHAFFALAERVRQLDFTKKKTFHRKFHTWTYHIWFLIRRHVANCSRLPRFHSPFSFGPFVVIHKLVPANLIIKLLI
jgi:hypothetical protein